MDKTCHHPDCQQIATYPAPKNRHNLQERIWFCLKHVREYNRQWCYYAGMEEQEIEASRTQDMTWQRPTWKFGQHYDLKKLLAELPFGEERIQTNPNTPQGQHRENTIWFSPRSPEAAALKVLKVKQPCSIQLVKQSYRNLVKQHHPDLNKGCRKAESQLKAINAAYSFLKGQLAF